MMPSQPTGQLNVLLPLLLFCHKLVGVQADQPGCHPACNLDFNCTTVPLKVAYADDLIIDCEPCERRWCC